MLSRTYSRWSSFYNKEALATAPFVTNGQVVQGVMDQGVMKMRPSNATADSIFYGLSWGIYRGLGNTIPKLEVVRVGAANGALASGILSKVNAGTAYIYRGSDYSGTLMTATTSNADPTGQNDYRIEADNRTITVDDQNANADLYVVYNYSPTVNEIRFLYEGAGDFMPGNNAPAYFGQVGVITEGIVFTDQFDASVNWANTNDTTVIKGGANGKLTTSGNGCVCKGLRVHTAPSVDNPYLGVTLGYSI